MWASPGDENADQLIKGTDPHTEPHPNPYKMGCFYTFENEIGESAPSKITEVRMQRPQSNWKWETRRSRQ